MLHRLGFIPLEGPKSKAQDFDQLILYVRRQFQERGWHKSSQSETSVVCVLRIRLILWTATIIRVESR